MENNAHKRNYGPFGGVYFKIRSMESVWKNILNKRALNQLRTWNPSLGDTEQSIVDDLKRDGIAVRQVEELWPDGEMFSKLDAYARSLADKAATKTNKAFLQQMWDAEPTLDFTNPFVDLSLDSRILRIVSGYLTVMARFYYLTLNITKPVPEGSTAVQSQRWHRDPEDIRTCKVFLYLNDVPETAGPFIYVKGSQRGGKWGHLFPQKPPRGCYPDGALLEKTIPKEDILVATGKKGSIIFCDTAGLHKGGYATKDERIMFTAGYCTDASVWPLRFVRPIEFEAKVKTLTPEAGYALEYKL